MFFKIPAFYGSLCLALMSFHPFATAEAHSIILFGATGNVGNQVLRSILHEDSFFTKIVIVGRRFPPQVTDLVPLSKTTEVIQVKLQDLGKADMHEDLRKVGKVDACVIATGSGHPHLSDLSSFHYVEIEMTASMTRLCKTLGVRSITAFSATDAPEGVSPYTQEELDSSSDGTPMGWLGMLKHVYNMYGLKEDAVVSNASPGVPYVRIFQPSTIITEEYRYGWVDKILFMVHSWLDPWIPSQYRSVPVSLLGKAMVKDLVRILSSNDNIPEGVTRFTYNDFHSIVGMETGKTGNSLSDQQSKEL